MFVEWNPELIFLVHNGWWISAGASVTYTDLYSKAHVNLFTVPELYAFEYKIKETMPTFEIYIS